MKHLIISLCVPVLGAVGCNTPFTESGLDLDERHAANASMVHDMTRMQREAGVIGANTLYPYHFVNGSPQLNDLGRHDLGLLTAHYKDYVLPHLEPVTVLQDVEVFFEYDEANLLQEARTTLDDALRILEDNPNAQLLISGHADVRGTQSYNLNLGERRAAEVAGYLESSGLDPNRIQILSRGEFDAIAPVTDEEGMAQDRRAQFLVAEGQEFPIVLNVRRGSASERLYSARKQTVLEYLGEQSVPRGAITLADGPSGGDGVDSVRAVMVLTGENLEQAGEPYGIVPIGQFGTE